MPNSTTKKGWSEDNLVKALEDLQEKISLLKVQSITNEHPVCMYVCIYYARGKSKVGSTSGPEVMLA